MKKKIFGEKSEEKTDFEKGMAIDPTCLNTGRLERTKPNAFEIGGDLNARNPTSYILNGAVGSTDTRFYEINRVL